MSFIYVGAGVLLLFSKIFFNFSDLQKFGMGFILILYGTFRFYQVLKKKKEHEENNDK